MQLQTQTRPKVISVTVLEDRIDAATAIQFKEKMRDATQDGPVRVVLDLARVQFLDSSGLGAIVAVKKGAGAVRPDPDRRKSVPADADGQHLHDPFLA
jgi:anti-sigma B factor antagonist